MIPYLNVKKFNIYLDHFKTVISEKVMQVLFDCGLHFVFFLIKMY